jgi:TonB family protein
VSVGSHTGRVPVLLFTPAKVRPFPTDKSYGRTQETKMIAKGVAGILLALVLPALAQEPSKKVSQSEAMGAVVTKYQPEYPMIARQLRIEGEVSLEAVVAENGTVEKVNIVSGNPVLTKPAADALKRWKFKPFTADGKPVKVLAPVSMAFRKEQ